MHHSLSALPDNRLLAMLVGADVAANLASYSLPEMFGLCADTGINRVSDTEAMYLASPILGAAKELYLRALISQMSHERIPLTSPGAVRQLLISRLAHLEHEVFWVMFLDAQNRLIDCQEMFRGTLTQTSIYPREVVKAALAHNAAAVIFAHNHPSGVGEPSRADELLTRVLKEALTMVDVKLLDHFIVAGLATVSFAERGLI